MAVDIVVAGSDILGALTSALGAGLVSWVADAAAPGIVGAILGAIAMHLVYDKKLG